MSSRRLIKFVCWLLGAILVIGILPLTVRTQSSFTCTLCRVERIDNSLIGFPWQTFRDSEFTEWYRKHRPQHVHAWGWQGTIRGISLFGATTYRACGVHHPVCDIPQTTLQEFCEQADDSTLATYFDGITSTNPDIQTQTVQMVLNRVFADK